MSIPGMQIIGFKCDVLDGKKPDPLPGIQQWI
jgi:hypothetical protein